MGNGWGWVVWLCFEGGGDGHGGLDGIGNWEVFWVSRCKAS